MKKYSIGKSILYTVIIVTLFFTSLEVLQRVRYFFRYRHNYWLLYGLVEKPEDYAEMLYMDKKRKETGLGGVEVIEVRQIWYGTPNDRYRKNNPKYKTDKITINSYGFRGREFDIKKKEGVFRIVALGGSTTFGMGRDDSTYPAFLERILNSKSGRRFEVINAGVGAVGIKEITALFRNEVIRLNPDMIIINSLFNNLYLSSLTYEGYGWLQGLNIFLMSKSLFYQTMREKTALILRKPVSDLYRVSVGQIVKNFMENDIFWLNLENDYRDIIKTADLNGCEVIIIKQPVLLFDGNPYSTGMLLDKRLKPVYEKAYSLFDKIDQDCQNVHTVGVLSYFESVSDKESLFMDGLHLTPSGDGLIAGIIAEKIEEIYTED